MSSPPAYEIAVAQFIVSADVERSRRFYTEVLGGTTILAGEPSYVALANTWIIINTGGGPTDDKPAVTLETPPDPDRTSAFLNIGPGMRHIPGGRSWFPQTTAVLIEIGGIFSRSVS